MKHNFPFDPTYGYTPEQLRAIGPPPEPGDFDTFWQSTRVETLAEPLALEVREGVSSSAVHRVSDVYFNTLDAVRVGAWLVERRDVASTCGAVVGHGYGPRGGPEYPEQSVASLFVNAPGFALSASPDIPGESSGHVIHGLARRETYILRHCVASLWTGAHVLAELVPSVRDAIVYSGESFGGGLGALALPWEPIFRRAFLCVPTFGHHPLRLTMPCNGSGEAVRRYAETHPRVLDVLQYFDAATAAKRVRIPVLAAPACFDPAVPPPGQFAVCNALGGPTERDELSAGHFRYAAEAAERQELARRLERFLWA